MIRMRKMKIKMRKIMKMNKLVKINKKTKWKTNYLKKKLKREFKHYLKVLLMSVLIMLGRVYLKITKLYFPL